MQTGWDKQEMADKILGDKIKALSEIIRKKYNLELNYGFECKQSNSSTLMDTNINAINVYGIYFFVDEDENLIYSPMSKSSKYISKALADINNRNPNNASYSNAYDSIASCYRNNKKVFFYYIEIDKNKIGKIKTEIKNICISILRNNDANINNSSENELVITNNMNLAPHYQWIDYFKLLTDKILEYKNNRNEFRKKVINVLSEYSKIGNYEISGIDPLSFIYELARLWIRKDKKIIYNKVAEEFNIQCDLGNIDKWIFLNPIHNTFFYYGNELLDNDIHWNIFIMAKNIDFIDEKIFQNILEIKNISIAKLTQVLSIIEPDKYIPYDKRTTNYSQIDYNKNEHQYINYKKHIETIQNLFPKCSLYETSIFMKINDRIKYIENRKIYQISSYMENGVNGTKDHTDFFHNQSAVYLDGKQSDGGTRYPIAEPKKGDIIIARRGNKTNGIGIIIQNEYSDDIFTLDKRIYVIWINKNSFDNILSQPRYLALKLMDEIDIKKCKNVYRETFKILGIDGMENKEIKDIKNIFEFKKQTILQGAPGTGKTYTAKKVAEAIGCDYEVIQFHPSYTYEDFVRGIVSKTDENGNISYEVEDKILMNAIEKAKEHEKYILIIDEINRANLPSVLGELLYALEYREEPVICPYKKDKEDDGKIIIPKTLYIIGTMNTADRSIGSIDYAVRRRFAFYTVKANEEYIKDDYSKKVFKYIKNEIIEKHLSEEYQLDDIMIGHSYFIFSDEAYSDEDLAYKYMNLSLQYNIIPLLEEYYKDGILIDNEKGKVKDKIKELKEKYSEAEQ